MTGGASALCDTAWYSTTCVLGWDVQGIWPKGEDGTSVNALCKSPQAGGVNLEGDYGMEGVIATGTDDGKVNMFRWPLPICTVPLGSSNPGLLEGSTECKSFGGHSSHVSNCVFTSENAVNEPGEEYLVTVGGNDDTVIVWKHTMAVF